MDEEGRGAKERDRGRGGERTQRRRFKPVMLYLNRSVMFYRARDASCEEWATPGQS